MTPSPSPDHATAALLARWFDGDRVALGELIEENLEFLQHVARGHLDAGLRRDFDSLDVVGAAVTKLLSTTPRFLPAGREQFRALLRTVVVNEIRDRHDRIRLDRRQELGKSNEFGDSVVDLGLVDRSSLAPERQLEKAHMRAWARLALEFLESEDRRLVCMRMFGELEFAAIASELGISSADAARMRFEAAKPRLANAIRRLQAGELPALAEGPDTAP